MLPHLSDELEMFGIMAGYGRGGGRRQEALVEAKRGRIGTCEWRNLVSLLDRFWNEVRISLMRIPCMQSQSCANCIGDGSVGLKLPPRFPNMQSEHGLQAKEGRKAARLRRLLRLPSSAAVTEFCHRLITAASSCLPACLLVLSVRWNS